MRKNRESEMMKKPLSKRRFFLFSPENILQSPAKPFFIPDVKSEIENENRQKSGDNSQKRTGNHIGAKMLQQINS